MDYSIDLMVPGRSGGKDSLIGMIQRCLILIAVIAFPLFVHVSPCRSQESKAKKPPPELTDEEKEIIKDREVLENLTLLQNIDKIEFIDILNEMDPGWSESEPTDKPVEVKEEGNKP